MEIKGPNSKTFFSNLLERAKADGIEKFTQQSYRWYIQQLEGLRYSINPTRLLYNPELRIKSTTAIKHKLFMFQYKPKGKDKLKYYDAFPLVLITDKAPGGFRGINFHYLDYFYRARLFDALRELYQTNEYYDITTKLRVDYRRLKGKERTEEFEPCYKHYLANNILGRATLVPAKYWEAVLFLPSDRYKKANRLRVWRESKRIAI